MNEDRKRPKDHVLATIMRMDPERLAALRRISSGVTRCPECDAANPAAERRCSKCGAPLYPEEEMERIEKDQG